MNTTKVVIVGISFFMAVGSAFLFSSMLKPGDQTREPLIAKEEVVTKIKVLVASTDIASGARLSTANMKWQTWQGDNISADFITDQSSPNALSEYTGGLVRSALFEGETIDNSKVVSLREARGFMSVLLNPGKRAYSIVLSPVNGVGGFVLPGDHVDVLLTRNTRASNGDTVVDTSVLLYNIRIMAIDQSITGVQGSILGRTATVEVSPIESRILASGSAEGSISLALRSLSDNSDETMSTASGKVTVIRAGRKNIALMR